MMYDVYVWLKVKVKADFPLLCGPWAGAESASAPAMFPALRSALLCVGV